LRRRCLRCSTSGMHRSLRPACGHRKTCDAVYVYV
jgi:hypothetical protein